MATPGTQNPMRSLVGRELEMAGSRKSVDQGEGRPVPLDLLDSNPFQHRVRMDEDALEELIASIEKNGQLEAVPVRSHPTNPGRFQLVAGHRRAEAFRRLKARATTDDDRLRWSQILATIKPSVTDRQMRIWSVVENAEREDTSPVEQGTALLELQEKESLTLEQLIAETGMEPDRVKRLIRIAKAPDVIKDGCTKGIMVALTDENGKPLTTPKGRVKQEHRNLDLIAALEFAALHAHYLRSGLSPKKASERVERLVAQALTDGWSLRRIQERCKELKAARPGRDPAETSQDTTEGAGEGTSPAASETTPEPPLYKRDDRQVVVYLKRLAGASPTQKAQLAALLDEVRASLTTASE